MTPLVMAMLRNMAECRLAEIEAEATNLRQAIRELAAPSNGHAPAPAPAPAAPDAAPAAETAPGIVSALEARLNALRDEHGPVFVIEPKGPVEAGMRFPWGKAGNEKPVEVIERAELADRTGKIVPGRVFVKLLDV